MKTFILIVAFLAFAVSPLVAGDGKGKEYLRQGTAYFEAEDYQRAVKAFGQAVRSDPGSAEAHRGMGMAYLKLGSGVAATNVELVDKAAAAFNEVLRIAPDSAETRYHLGLACLLQDDKKGAIREYQALRDLNSGLAEQLQSSITAYKAPKSFRTLVGQVDRKDDSTRITVAGNQVLVPVTLSHDGKTVQATLLLDTGASSILITRDLAGRLNLDPDRGRRTMLQVADGRQVQAWHTRLDRVTVGPKSKTGLDVSVVLESGGTFPFDGLLGMNFLRSFKYSVDFTNQVINWSR